MVHKLLLTSLVVGGIMVAGAASADEQYTLTIKDHAFSPETLSIPAGQQVKLLVINNDASPEEFESEKLGREKVIAANSQATIVVGPLEAGEYPFVGEFHQETAKGKIIAQ
jgi:plastocyanin